MYNNSFVAFYFHKINILNAHLNNYLRMIRTSHFKVKFDPKIKVRFKFKHKNHEEPSVIESGNVIHISHSTCWFIFKLMKYFF